MNKWLMNNNAAKIVALVLGVLLFVVVHKDDSTPVALQPPVLESHWMDNVKIEVIGLDKRQWVIKSMKPDKVRVQVRGKRPTIASASPENQRVLLDLTGYRKGKHVVQLNPDFPLGIHFVSMQPSSVTVELEDIQTKEFEVQVRTEGSPTHGYMVGKPIVKSSNKVHVTLPASRMAEVKSIVGIVNVDKANDSLITKQIKLIAYSAEGNKAIEGAILTPSFVEVEVPITKPSKVVPLQINLLGQLTEKLAISSLTSDVNQVTLYGPHEVLAPIEYFDNVNVDLHLFYAAGSHKLKMTLTPPTNIEKIEPSEITVDLQISDIKQRTITNVPISLTGDNERLTTTIMEPTSHNVDIVIAGAPNLIDKLKIDDIQLIADVKDLPPGEHIVDLQVNLPRFVRRADSTPLTIKVDIKDKDTEAPVPILPDSKPPVPNLEGGGDPASGT